MKCRPFTMSSESHRGSALGLIIPIALLAIISLGAGYYFAYAKSSNFPVSWSINPLMIKFNASGPFSGSAADSFTCSPSVSPVTLQAFSSRPDIITITVSPSSFSRCGPTPDDVVVTASCTSSISSVCDGEYTGSVQVCGPSTYTCLKQSLVVTVAVTTHKCPCPTTSG